MKCNYKNRDTRNKKVVVECTCGKSFSSNQINLQSRKLGGIDEIEETYYNCPHCCKEYVIIKTSHEIRELMAQRDRMKGFAHESVSEIAEYEQLDKYIKEKTNKLNDK